MMSSLPQVPPVQSALPAQPVQIDAFSAALNAAGAALSANPDAIGQTLLSGIDGFNARETQFRTVVEHAAAGNASQNTATDVGDPPPSAGSDGATPRRLTAVQAMQEGEALQRQSLGVMMQTYSFALEATLVSNAATTFTSSVNTLIKTQ
jgi:hypothetical protein